MSNQFATLNPSNGQVLATFHAATDAAVSAAIASATSAYGHWSKTDVSVRVDLLQRLAAHFRDNTDELAALTTLEMGKPISQAKGEVGLCATIFQYYADKATELLRDEELDIAGAGRAVVSTLPIGPILGIMPWNFPYYQVVRFAAPNILLGNTILLKHAINCPQEALRIQSAFEECGAPEGVYRDIFATHEQVADIIAHPDIQGVSLTGSERAGRVIGALAGQHLKKCVLELGGSDPFIVLDDANLDDAVDAAVFGRFRNAGQVCSSSKRFIVLDPIYDEFMDKFVAKSREWTLGDPTDPETLVGPLSSIAARNDLTSQVSDALDKGATLHLGGEIPDQPGAWYPPTILSGLTPDMRAYREELFGPVAMVYRVSSADDAIRLANDSPYGLGGAVFSSNEDRALQVAAQLVVGMVGLNTTIKSAPDLPFGGVKNSGMGRELARFGIDEFSNKKLVRFA
jgi:succinate-semialdehyde dehydrogenase/glutarate-semialdehyde dehydrogenase